MNEQVIKMRYRSKRSPEFCRALYEKRDGKVICAMQNADDDK